MKVPPRFSLNRASLRGSEAPKASCVLRALCPKSLLRGGFPNWTGARVAEGSRLLSGWSRKRLAGSNPAPSVAVRSQEAKRGVAPAVNSDDASKAPGESKRPGCAATAKAPYYLTPKAAPWAFKPYDRRQAKRDRHDCHNLSHKLSAALRRQRKNHGRASAGPGRVERRDR